MPRRDKWFAIQLPAQDDCDQYDIFCIIWLNAFPVKNGVSQLLSPQSIMVQNKLICKKHCRVKFGDYAEVHDEPYPRKAISPRTHPEIAAGTTGYSNYTVKFFCLITGRILKRRNFTRYPMIDIISKKTNAWGKKKKREVYDNAIKFKYRRKNPY